MFILNIFIILWLQSAIVTSYLSSKSISSPYHLFNRQSTRQSLDRIIVEPQTVLYSSKLSKPSTISAVNPESVPKVNFLVHLWESISNPQSNPVDGREFRLKDYSLNRISVKSVLNHFQACKDCAADDAVLIATQDKDKNDMLILTAGHFKLFSDDPEDDELWDDEDDIKLKYANETDQAINTLPVFPIEPDDAKVMTITKEWIKKVIAEFNVCPFTMDPDKAGIPMGGVRYTISRAKTAEEAFYAYWKEVQYLLTVPEKETSTVLLIFPEIDLFGNFELFEMYCESLSDGLSCSSLGLEDELQLVFFHPKYQFRDGMARVGEAHGAANYARRSPWPMINILRTPQVRAAQKGIPTGLVYKQNEERLAAVGTKVLEEMLTKCDWSLLPTISANVKLEQIKVALERGRQLQIAEHNQLLISTSPSAGVCPFHLEGDGSYAGQDSPSLVSTDKTVELSSSDQKLLEFEDPEKLADLLRSHENAVSVRDIVPVKPVKEIDSVNPPPRLTDSDVKTLSDEELMQLVDEVDQWLQQETNK